MHKNRKSIQLAIKNTNGDSLEKICVLTFWTHNESPTKNSKWHWCVKMKTKAHTKINLITIYETFSFIYRSCEKKLMNTWKTLRQSADDSGLHTWCCAHPQSPDAVLVFSQGNCCASFLGLGQLYYQFLYCFLRFLWGLLTFKRDSLFDNGSVCLIFWILFGEHLSVKYKRGYGFTIAKCGTSHNYSA